MNAPLPKASDSELPVSKSIQSTLVSRNVTIDGHRTSVRLEPSMWTSFIEICRRERSNLHVICTAIAQHKPAATSLTAAIRVFIMSYFRAAATEEGHVKSGHGQGPATNAIGLLVQTVLDPGSAPYPLPSPYIIGKAYPSITTRESYPSNLQSMDVRRFPRR